MVFFYLFGFVKLWLAFIGTNKKKRKIYKKNKIQNWFGWVFFRKNSRIDLFFRSDLHLSNQKEIKTNRRNRQKWSQAQFGIAMSNFLDILCAKKQTKLIIQWKQSFKGKKCFKSKDFVLRLPPSRSIVHTILPIS